MTQTASKAWWIARASVLAVAALGLVGCAGEVGDADVASLSPVGSVSSKIFGGVSTLGRADDGVVALRVGSGTSFELCTGALVAPNVVLTARHCITKNYGTKVACDAEGRSTNGKHVAGDEELSNIAIYTGAQPRFASKPDAKASAIVAPSSYYLCDSDIALVVLDRELPGTPFKVRLHAPARTGERLKAIGYGHNDRDLPLGTRLEKPGVPVLKMGNGISESRTALGPHEFEVGQSICQGDSGGPAISEETGAVIGVVSRGGDCEDDFGHVYTTTAGFGALFDEAFSLAGGNVASEVATETRMPDARGLSTDEGLGEAPTAATKTEARAGSCSASPGSSRAGGVGGLVLAFAAVLAARARRRGR